METLTTKAALLETLRNERSAWDALLAEVGADRLERPGVTGEWSVKDIIAHLMSWESRPVEWLRAARSGTRPQPPAWDATLTEDQINAWIRDQYKAQSPTDVMAASRRSHDELMQAIEAMPEPDLTGRERFPWLNGNSLLESMGGNTYEHYREHGDAIRAWLAR